MTKALKEKARRRSQRRARIRAKVAGTSERPRLSVYRSNRGFFAQLIDDERGHTVAAVSWTESDLRPLAPKERATRAGELFSERAKAAGVESCVFDRGGYRYHGIVKAFADAARSGGLRF
jgi:large subunit ribosomal protein L18